MSLCPQRLKVNNKTIYVIFQLIYLCTPTYCSNIPKGRLVHLTFLLLVEREGFSDDKWFVSWQDVRRGKLTMYLCTSPSAFCNINIVNFIIYNLKAVQMRYLTHKNCKFILCIALRVLNTMSDDVTICQLVNNILYLINFQMVPKNVLQTQHSNLQNQADATY